MSRQRIIQEKRQSLSMRYSAGPCSLFIGIMCLLSSTDARSGESVSADAETRLTLAFTNGLGNFGDGKPPAFLEIRRDGRHWKLTGLDRNGDSVEQLQCLLCTEMEATVAAAHLGDLIGRRLRQEPPPSPPDATKAILSLDGAPVSPPLPETEAARIDPPMTDRRPFRLRWAVAAASLGAAAAATGGIFMWLDGKCSTEICDYRHTGIKGPGIGLVVTGALLETAAILLWRLKRKPREKTP